MSHNDITNCTAHLQSALFAVVPIFFVIMLIIVLLPSYIAKKRGVDMKAVFGGEEDFLLSVIRFPFQLYKALTAKPGTSVGMNTMSKKDEIVNSQTND